MQNPATFPHYQKCNEEGVHEGKCFLKTYVPSSAVHFTACFGMYLHEIQRELWEFLQIDVNVSTVYRHLHENGLPAKDSGMQPYREMSC